LFSLLCTYNILFDAVQSGSRNRAVVALHQAATQWSRPLFAVLLFAVVGVSLTSALAGYSLAMFLVICSQFAFLVFQLRSRSSPNQSGPDPKEIERKLSAYALPFASWGALSWVQIASDRWFLEFFHDAKAVGAYTVCYQLGYFPMTLLTTALSNLVAPILFEMAGHGEDGARLTAAWQANRLHIWALLALTIGVTAAFALLHKEVFRWFTVSGYYPYSGYLPILAIAAGIFAIAQAQSLTCLIRGRSSELTGVKIIPALAGLVFNLVGAYWFGVRGAVAATLLFSVVYLVAVVRVTGAKSVGEPGVSELKRELVKV
jgi:O-antigen/teichoic acid export membrane protein